VRRRLFLIPCWPLVRTSWRPVRRLLVRPDQVASGGLTIVQKAPKIRITLIHITDARRGDCIGSVVRDFTVPSRGRE